MKVLEFVETIEISKYNSQWTWPNLLWTYIYFFLVDDSFTSFIAVTGGVHYRCKLSYAGFNGLQRG